TESPNRRLPNPVATGTMRSPQTLSKVPRTVSWRSLMRKTLSLAAALIAALAIAAPVGAITNGAPDNGEHPYVGELLFYVPHVPRTRFTDPGCLFTCICHIAHTNE